ncbi:MAG: hypothetical protein RSA71_04690 [Eubacterium sp.]
MSPHLIPNETTMTVVFFCTRGELPMDVKISPKQDTVWLNRQQKAELFDRDSKQLVNILTMQFQKNGRIKWQNAPQYGCHPAFPKRKRIRPFRLSTNPGQGADKNTRTPVPLRAGALRNRNCAVFATLVQEPKVIGNKRLLGPG